MKVIASLMIVAGILHFLFPVVCKVQDFEDDLEWRVSELSASENTDEEKMKESIIYMGSHADMAIWQWRRKSKWGSGLLIFFGVVVLIASSLRTQNQTAQVNPCNPPENPRIT